HARGPVPGLHPHRARQGNERATGRLPPRAAQRAHPADHAHRPRAARPCQRRTGCRGRLRVARHRQARLRACAPVRLLDGDGGHVLRHSARDRRQPARRSALRRARSKDSLRMIGPSRVAELDMPAAGIETGTARPAQSYWNESWERLRANRIGIAAGILILIFAVIAVMAPLFSLLLTHYQPQTINLDQTFMKPGSTHLLGSDELGRDTLTRLIWGARVSLGVAFLTVAMSLTLGTTVGMVAGYYGGWIDDVLMRLVDTVLAIPAIFLFILMSILFRPNAFTLAAI